MCIAKNAIRSTNLIIYQFGLFFKERDPRILFMLNNLQNYLIKAFDHFRLFFAQSRLIGHLEDVPKRFRPFPYNPRTARPNLLTACTTWLIWSLNTMPGKCTMAEPRIAVPTFVGHAVR